MLNRYCTSKEDFANTVYEKWQAEVYGLLACPIKYTEKLIEELKLKIILKEFNVCCEEKITCNN